MLRFCFRGSRAITLSLVAGPVWSLLLFLWEWLSRAPMLVDMSVPMTAQHAIITGGCGGMGEELAVMMMTAGAHVVLACRDEATGDAAVDRINAKALGNSGSVEHIALDLASLKSVNEFAREYTRSHKQLHVLVNNGGTAKACTMTEDGNEHAFQVNYLSHFLLTQLLLPTLKRTGSARIVHVTCPAAERAGELPPRGVWGWLYDQVFASGEAPEPPPPIDVSNLNALSSDDLAQPGAQRCSPVQQYAMSKLALIAFNKELDDQLAHELHPEVLNPKPETQNPKP
jgi:NAD(P)-dependent dehydrogenase (short-subunit alcohol dehydrogenase family)